MHKVLAKYLEESGKKGKKQGPEKFTLKHSENLHDTHGKLADMSSKSISKAHHAMKEAHTLLQEHMQYGDADGDENFLGEAKYHFNRAKEHLVKSKSEDHPQHDRAIAVGLYNKGIHGYNQLAKGK